MARRKVGIIGHFGGPENITDGQTVKTKILYTELLQATDWEITIVDTYYKKKNPLKLAWDSIKCMVMTRDIIVLLSGNGMKLYFPILWCFAHFLKRRIYHDVIGGNLDNYVKQVPSFRKYLNSFQVNWVETKGLKKRLENVGVTNCEILPNFKRLNIVQTESLKKLEQPYKLCTFSRVMKEKGIEDAITAVEILNLEYGNQYCALDIYGLIDDGYKDTFDTLMSKTTEAISYKGVVPFDKSAEVLKEYHALLFPTFWMGEGFPGTIVDAFSSGLPVVASDWSSNAEIVENGITGIIYPSLYADNLVDAILYLINNANNYEAMRIRCLIEAKKYQPEGNIEKIKGRIE